MVKKIKKTIRLGELLVSKNLVSQQSVDKALQENNEPLGSTLEKKGLIEKKVLLEVLIHQHGHPGILLSKSVLKLEALGYVPKFLALEHKILPIMKTENSLVLAVQNPEQKELFDHLRYVSNLYIITLIALSSELLPTIEQAYEAYNKKDLFLALDSNIATNQPHLEILRPKEYQPQQNIEWRIPWDFNPFASQYNQSNESNEKDLHHDKKVLIVDDDPAINRMLSLLMKKDGYQVQDALTGTEALQKIQIFKPNLILLDAMLPEVHGFEIAHHVKSSELFKNTKIIMVSAIYRGWKSTKNILEIHSADAFVEKPFDVSYIRKLVSDMLGSHINLQPEQSHPDTHNQEISSIKEELKKSYRKENMSVLRKVLEWSELEPFNFIPHLIRGNLHWKSENYDEALLSYEQAATFASQNKTANHNLSVAYQQLGFLSKAKSRWTHTNVLEKDFPDEITREEILLEF